MIRLDYMSGQWLRTAGVRKVWQCVTYVCECVSDIRIDTHKLISIEKCLAVGSEQECNVNYGFLYMWAAFYAFCFLLLHLLKNSLLSTEYSLALIVQNTIYNVNYVTKRTSTVNLYYIQQNTSKEKYC